MKFFILVPKKNNLLFVTIRALKMLEVLYDDKMHVSQNFNMILVRKMGQSFQQLLHLKQEILERHDEGLRSRKE